MNTNVLYAVFKRNFVSYFSNPTGYAFICVFVLLSSFAAFWPNEFFQANLANLSQLNMVFPFIMLVFIPAITMSIWAEERRQGTDELLLTIPAGDFDIVLGKYLAAVVIYTVSLLFSLICNYAVLAYLGTPDGWLLVAAYVGFWMVGLAMLAIGMVASFLTDNLTVGYVLGAVLNAPLVCAVWADAILGREAAVAVKQWSIGEQFNDFGRGVISLSGLAYFVMIVVVMLYVSMVLIGRRHWARGRDWYAMGVQYAVRAVALVVIAVNVNVFFQNYNLQADWTDERLNSLSADTKKLLADLKIEQPVQVEAFISPAVPEAYVQTRLDLLAMLRDLKARGGEKVRLRINDTERFSDEADRARELYDVSPREVAAPSRGTTPVEHIFMAVAFTCGLEKVILPFIDRGVPIEYELVRSICTVCQQERKKVGILQTDAPLYGRFNMQTMSSSSNWPIITELEKQYEVVQVDATGPITEKYDVLLAVQPSSLGPQQMESFIAAIKNGQPTAIFEDPFPGFAGEVPGTGDPRRPPGGMNPMMGMMGGRQQPQPKGNIGELWQTLGVDFSGSQIVWQSYNPYPKLAHFPKEMVFVDAGAAEEGHETFCQADPVSSNLQHMLFPFPGSVSKLHSSDLEFTALVETGSKTGEVAHGDMRQMSMFGPGGLNPQRRPDLTNKPYVLAAHIRGKIAPDQPMADEGDESGAGSTAKEETAGDGAAEDAAAEEKPEKKTEPSHSEEKPAKKPEPSEINVILVTDIDMLHGEFFMLREMGVLREEGIQFDNVTFVLNVLDSLAGDDRFAEIRKRRPKHRTLTRIDELAAERRDATSETRKVLRDKVDEVHAKEEKKLQDKIAQLKKRMQKENIDPQEVLQRVGLVMESGQKRLKAQTEKLEQERDREIEKIDRKIAREVRQEQDWYKMWAVILPPIPPLLVAMVVFFTRRAREREGVARTRLR